MARRCRAIWLARLVRYAATAEGGRSAHEVELWICWTLGVRGGSGFLALG